MLVWILKINPLHRILSFFFFAFIVLDPSKSRKTNQDSLNYIFENLSYYEIGIIFQLCAKIVKTDSDLKIYKNIYQHENGISPNAWTFIIDNYKNLFQLNSFRAKDYALLSRFNNFFKKLPFNLDNNFVEKLELDCNNQEKIKFLSKCFKVTFSIL